MSSRREWLSLIVLVALPSLREGGIIPDFLGVGTCKTLHLQPHFNPAKYSGYWFTQRKVPNKYTVTNFVPEITYPSSAFPPSNNRYLTSALYDDVAASTAGEKLGSCLNTHRNKWTGSFNDENYHETWVRNNWTRFDLPRSSCQKEIRIRHQKEILHLKKKTGARGVEICCQLKSERIIKQINKAFISFFFTLDMAFKCCGTLCPLTFFQYWYLNLQIWTQVYLSFSPKLVQLLPSCFDLLGGLDTTLNLWFAINRST